MLSVPRFKPYNHGKLRAGYVARDFTRAELSCKCCGAYYHWPEFIARLQILRNLIGKPIVINSAHRCPLHNAREGGAPLSQHLKLAVDIDLRGHDRAQLLTAARKAGFTGFGFYQNFLHVDLGRARAWHSGEKARQLWKIS